MSIIYYDFLITGFDIGNFRPVLCIIFFFKGRYKIALNATLRLHCFFEIRAGHALLILLTSKGDYKGHT